MAVYVNDGVVTIDSGGVPEIRFRVYVPSTQLYIGEGGISLANPENIGESGNTPGGWFEVRGDEEVEAK